jgi:hypothetical protein
VNEKIRWFNFGFFVCLVISSLCAVAFYKYYQGEINRSEGLAGELREVQSGVLERYRELESGNRRLRGIIEDARGYADGVANRLAAGARDYREAIAVIESVLEDLESLESVLAGGRSGSGVPGGHGGVPP